MTFSERRECWFRGPSGWGCYYTRQGRTVSFSWDVVVCRWFLVGHEREWEAAVERVRALFRNNRAAMQSDARLAGDAYYSNASHWPPALAQQAMTELKAVLNACIGSDLEYQRRQAQEARCS